MKLFEPAKNPEDIEDILLDPECVSERIRILKTHYNDIYHELEILVNESTPSEIADAYENLYKAFEDVFIVESRMLVQRSYLGLLKTQR